MAAKKTAELITTQGGICSGGCHGFSPSLVSAFYTTDDHPSLGRLLSRHWSRMAENVPTIMVKCVKR